jgi:hypothetical protein
MLCYRVRRGRAACDCRQSVIFCHDSLPRLMGRIRMLGARFGEGKALVVPRNAMASLKELRMGPKPLIDSRQMYSQFGVFGTATTVSERLSR